MSVAVVGAAHPNKRGPSRRFGISLCRPGDPIELRREPKNEYDEHAIAVYGRDIQIGYVKSERAASLAPMLDRGRVIMAIFQQQTDYGAVIRIAFDGLQPELPNLQPSSPHPDGVDSAFYPDPEWPD